MTDLMQVSGGMPSPGPVAPSSPARSNAGPEGKDFQSVLLQSLDEVHRLQGEADESVQRLLTGESTNVAEVITAVNKASIAFDLLMEIRNKLAEAYREIQQMQI